MEEITEVPVALESKIEQDLIKHNVTDMVLGALKEKYGGLRLRSVDDKEKYLEIKDAARDCSKVRNLIVNTCKKGREDANKVQKLWVAKEKEKVAIVAEVEDPLCAELERFEQEQQRKVTEEKKRQEEAYMQRTQALTKMGALYSDGFFALGGFSIEGLLVKESNDEVWANEILPNFEQEYTKEQAERIEFERIQAERDTQVKLEAQKLKKEQEEFRQQQLEFKKQQEELNRAAREKTELEEREKIRERTELQNSRLQKLIPYNPYGKDIPLGALWYMPDTEFDTLLSTTKELFKEEQERKQKKIEEQAAQKERERIEEEQRQAEQKRLQEEKLREEELEKAADKVKYAELIKKFSAIKLPDMRSGQYRKKVAVIREKLEEILSL